MPRILALHACATLDGAACPPHSRHAINDLLYFGTATPTGVVSRDDWSAFLRQYVTPAFPNGLSVWPASGQWLGSNGEIAHEQSYVLNLIHPNDTASETAINTAIAQYKSQFHQEAVLRVASAACAGV